jgi:TIM-barrel protein
MFAPRVALASLSGESDAAWARSGEEHAGAAFLGGIALDPDSRAAARELVARDRTEFLPDDPIAFVDRELAKLDDSSLFVGANVRSTAIGPLVAAAEVCASHDAALEVNAHCRQDELCAVGCGESLLRDTDRLCAYVDAAVDTGATVSVKVRAGVDGVNLVETARRVEAAGADLIHVDAMDSEPVVGDVADATDLFVIANNGVRGEASVREYLDAGADAVSVGRPSDNPVVLRRVRAAVDDWFETHPTEVTP